jgi:hypothetical protein
MDIKDMIAGLKKDYGCDEQGHDIGRDFSTNEMETPSEKYYLSPDFVHIPNPDFPEKSDHIFYTFYFTKKIPKSKVEEDDFELALKLQKDENDRLTEVSEQIRNDEEFARTLLLHKD